MGVLSCPGLLTLPVLLQIINIFTKILLILFLFMYKYLTFMQLGDFHACEIVISLFFIVTPK